MWIRPLRGMVVGAIAVFGIAALDVQPCAAQADRGPRDYLDRDQYGRPYRDRVFNDDFSNDRYGNPIEAQRAVAPEGRRFSRYNPDDGSFSEVYPNPPRTRASDGTRRDEPAPRVTSRYRPPMDDGIVRNNYANAPVYRHYYGGADRYDSPGYLDSAGRASALANGYSRRGVEEFHDAYGRGVRTNDVYPLNRDVNPRRYRGRELNGSVVGGGEGTSGPEDVEDFVRSELSVRPGANLRVSSTGTYTFRNYLDQGNQVHARFRQPVHRRWEYLGP